MIKSKIPLVPSVPEIDADDLIDKIMEESPTIDEGLNTVKTVVTLWNHIYIDCIKVQRESIESLVSQLDMCQRSLKELKDFMDEHPEIRTLKRKIENDK